MGDQDEAIFSLPSLKCLYFSPNIVVTNDYTGPSSDLATELNLGSSPPTLKVTAKGDIDPQTVTFSV